MTPYPFYNPNMANSAPNPNIPIGMNAQDIQLPFGVQNTLPQPLTPATSPFPSMYQDRQSLFGINPTYARGGSVSPLMEHIQSMGQRGDTILAHINPQEAMELAATHGGDINPNTGLPQFGFWDWVNDRLLTAPGGKYFGDKLVPLLASTVTYPIFGPLGSVLAGGLTSAGGGAAEDDNPWKGAARKGLEGMGIGAATALGMNLAGKALGAAAAAKTLAPNAARNLAMQSLKNLGGGPGLGRKLAMESLKALGAGSRAIAPQSSFPSLVSKAKSLWDSSSLLDKTLLATSLAGTTFGKSSQPQLQPQKQYEDTNVVLQDPGWRPDQMPSNLSPLSRAFIEHPNIYEAAMIPEHEYFQPKFASGGRYYHGMEGGQDDGINTHVKEGDYIWDADALSMYGDGNSEAGAYKLSKELNIPFSYESRSKHALGNFNAKVSPSELQIDEKYVTKLGNGNNKIGAKLFDKARENLRRHKRSASPNKIPPKAKSLSYYMFGGKS